MSVTRRRISVVVPTRDRPDVLPDALASIRGLEGPDLSFEILVADNGKVHDVRPLVEAFGGLYRRADVLGAAAVRNVALRAATGEFIAFLDDDDAWLATHLRPHIALLDDRSDLDAVIGQFIYVTPDLEPLSDPLPEKSPGEGDSLLKAMLGGFYPQIGTLVVRSNVRDTVGLLDERLRTTAEDWDWMLRIAQQRKLAFIQTPCILFRARPAYSWDSLQIPRARQCSRVFVRHAIQARRIWSSPSDVIRAHVRSQKHFYQYFVEAAHFRAVHGHGRAALHTIVNALRIFPVRGMFHLLAPRPLRSALITALTGRGRLT